MNLFCLCRCLAVLIATALGHKAFAEEESSSLQIIKASHTEDAPHLDGKLDEATWKRATVYKLELADDRRGKGQQLREEGRIRVMWDESHLYLGVDWDDRDVIAKGTRDHEFHFKLGDLCELFLKHDDDPRYWELYATPAEKMSCFWFSKRGAKIQTDTEFELRVAAHVNGTLNESGDEDRGWSAEIAVSRADLARPGGTARPARPASSWRILIARYNYAADDWRNPELSMTPRLSRTNYHLLEEYAVLELVR